MSKKKSKEVSVIARRVDALVFAGFATGIAAVVVLLGYALFANVI